MSIRYGKEYKRDVIRNMLRETHGFSPEMGERRLLRHVRQEYRVNPARTMRELRELLLEFPREYRRIRNALRLEGK
jgi:hypothetical protein